MLESDKMRKGSIVSLNTPNKMFENDLRKSVYPNTLDKNIQLLNSKQAEHEQFKKDLYLESKKLINSKTRNQIIDGNVKVIKKKKSKFDSKSIEDNKIKKNKKANKSGKKSSKAKKDQQDEQVFNVEKLTSTMSPMPVYDEIPQEQIIMFKDTFNENDKLNKQALNSVLNYK